MQKLMGVLQGEGDSENMAPAEERVAVGRSVGRRSRLLRVQRVADRLSPA